MCQQWSFLFSNMQVSYGVIKITKFNGFYSSSSDKAAKLVLDRATFSSSTQALLDMNWINLSSRRSMQRCLFMHKLINDSERNSMITRGTDYHSHNTHSKENIRSIRSNTNWGLLRSFHSAQTDWNSLPEDMRCLPYDAFKISLLKHFES